MKILHRPLVLGFSLAFAFAGLARAQWTGLGAGGTGTDINSTANWSGGTINGDFSTVTTSTLTLTGDSSGVINLTSPLNFNTASASNITLGNGTASPNDVINFNQTTGNLLEISGQAGSTLTIGSDVTLNLNASPSSVTLLNFVASTSTHVTALTGPTTPLAVVNGLITGATSSGATLVMENYTGFGITTGEQSAAPYMVLANNSNTFSAGLMQSAGFLGFTSIANSGTASALGSSGKIGLTNGASLDFVGTSSQSSNRVVEIGGANSSASIVNASTTPTTVSLNVVGAYYGSGSQVINAYAIGSNVLNFTGTVADGNSAAGTGTGTIAINKGSSFSLGSVGTYNGQGTGSLAATGALELSSSTGNTYSGGTTISAGLLLVSNTSGSATGSGAVTLSGTSTTLGGIGIISGGVSAGAGTIIAPGILSGTTGLTATTGTLTLNGGLTEATAGTLQLALNLNGTSAASFLSLGSGALTLGSNNTINLTFANLGGSSLVAGNWYTVMSGSGSWASSATITDSSGLPAGFSGFSSMYSGGLSGGSLQIEFSAVPEPSTWALLGLGLALLGVARIRKTVLLASRGSQWDELRSSV